MKILASSTGNRVLVKQGVPNNMIGGLVIPESVNKKPLKGEVVAVSDYFLNLKKGVVAPILKEGDVVLYEKNTGNEVELEGDKFVLLNEYDVYAVL